MSEQENSTAHGFIVLPAMTMEGRADGPDIMTYDQVPRGIVLPEFRLEGVTGDALQDHFNKAEEDAFDAAVAKFTEEEILKVSHHGARLRIEIAPGYQLHGFLSTIFPKSFAEKFLDELLNDGNDLYSERLAAGDYAGAWRVKWAMRYWMVRACFGGAITSLIAFCIGHWQSK